MHSWPVHKSQSPVEKAVLADFWPQQRAIVLSLSMKNGYWRQV